MKRIPLLALIVTVLLMAPALAQTAKPPTRTAPPANGGNNAAIFGGILGAVVTGIAIKAAQDAANKRDAEEQPATEVEPAPATTAPARKTPDYRDVPVPPARPGLFGDRPVDLDAPYDPTRIVVALHPDIVDAEALAAGLGAETGFDLVVIGIRRLELGGITLVACRIPADSDMAALLAALGAVPGVIGAQPQYIYTGAQQKTSAADMRSLQYAPARLKALAARTAGDGAGVTIGLIDTGIDLDQPELAGADIAAFDVMTDRPVENRDHGTALAGLMLARAGLDGIAPGARLVSVRAFDTDADGAVISGSYEIATAVDIAVAHGAQVLNLSFAGPRDPLVMSVLDAAADTGVVFVAAAGNGGADAEPAYPGAHRAAIAVTATDSQDAVFSGANRGYYIAVAAPGVDVLSPMPDDRFELLSGTSIATAHVTAVVALMLGHAPDLGRDAVLKVLEASARDLGEPGPDADYGAGLADAEAAVLAVSVK